MRGKIGRGHWDPGPELRTTQELAAKDYDAGRPAMTMDGTVNEKLQRAYLEMGLRRMEVKESPSPEKVFDFLLRRRFFRARS